MLIAQQVLVLFILIGVGFLCGKKGIINDVASKKMTDIVLYVVTPCVMISAFQREFTFELIGKMAVAVVCAALIIAGSIAIAKLVFHDKNIGRQKVLGVSYKFSALLSLFLFVCAGYFIYKDATVYPKMKRELNEMEKRTDELKAQVDNDVFDFDITDL